MIPRRIKRSASRHSRGRHSLVTGLLLAVLVAGCSTRAPDYDSVPQAPPVYDDSTVKIGRPYQVNGVWYHPADDLYYDQLGIASWYGPEFHGRRTANGEIFDMNNVSAAHTTLPMPSYVRVTNLENGRSMVIRVNDRGPFARGRIIDLSRRAAELLGFRERGTARVRVQRVRPSGDPYSLPETQVAGAQTDSTRWITPERYEEVERLAPLETELYVQVGAFANPQAAERVRLDVDWIGPAITVPVEIDARRLHRVRIGPLASVEQADAILARVIDFGYVDSRIVLE